MNTKTYKVLKIILSHPNEWQAVPNMAYEVNMTNRQVSSIICAYEHIPLLKERDNSVGVSYVMFRGSPELAKKILDEITEDYYGISHEMKENVYRSLSPVAWMSVSDIMDDTNYNRCDVARTLGLLEGVTTKTSGVLVLYRRDSPEVD